MHFDAKEIQFRREHNERAWIAWHTAALAKTGKRMPKLEKLLLREKSNKPQTWQEQRKIVRMINAMLGGKDLKGK